MAEDRFAWQRLAAQIRQRIADGTYGIGDLIPTVRQLVESEGRSDNTITRALADLAEEGLIRGEVGVGTRVVAKPGAVPLTAEQQLTELRDRVAAQELLGAQHEARIRDLEQRET